MFLPKRPMIYKSLFTFPFKKKSFILDNEQKKNQITQVIDHRQQTS